MVTQCLSPLNSNLVSKPNPSFLQAHTHSKSVPESSDKKHRIGICDFVRESPLGGRAASWASSSSPHGGSRPASVPVFIVGVFSFHGGAVAAAASVSAVLPAAVLFGRRHRGYGRRPLLCLPLPQSRRLLLLLRVALHVRAAALHLVEHPEGQGITAHHGVGAGKEKKKKKSQHCGTLKVTKHRGMLVANNFSWAEFKDCCCLAFYCLSVTCRSKITPQQNDTLSSLGRSRSNSFNYSLPGATADRVLPRSHKPKWSVILPDVLTWFWLPMLLSTN